MAVSYVQDYSTFLSCITLDGKLVDCAITSPGSQRVPNGRRPLVACESQSTEEIESAYKKWNSKNSGS